MKKYINKLLFVSLIITCIITGFSMIKTKASAKTTYVKVTKGNSVKKYAYKKQTVYYEGKKIATSKLPTVSISSTWMGSAEAIFKSGLKCDYSYNKETKKIFITNTVTGKTLEMTVNSKTATMGETSYKMSVAPYTAKLGTTSGVLVPVSFVAKKLGFSYSYSSKSKKLSIYKLKVYLTQAETDNYNTATCNNCITKFAITKSANSKVETVKITTIKDLDSSSVSVTNNEADNSITYTFAKTHNSLSSISGKGNKAVSSFSVSQEGTDTVITLFYNSKYEYTNAAATSGYSCRFSSAPYSLKISTPEDVAYDSITTTDQYYKKQFYITIPGTQKEYFTNNPIVQNNHIIKSITISETSAGNTKILVKTTKLQGFKLTNKEGYFTVQIDDPKNVYSNIIVLDAGHGGKDSGATNKGTKEKNINQTIIYSKAKKYFDSKESTVKAYWTRTDDTFIPLYDRAAFAKKVGADLFLSLHQNSCEKSSINGMEVYYSTYNNGALNNSFKSQIMAKYFNSNIQNDLNISSRGVKTANFVVIKHNTVPSVLLELGFLSGTSDYKRLTSSSYQAKAAKSIFDTVTKIFSDYPTGRADEE